MVRDLIVRESSCCSFFDFHLTPAEDRLVLDGRAPEARVEVLDGSPVARNPPGSVGTGSRAIG
jgi:hypothetical protein